MHGTRNLLPISYEASGGGHTVDPDTWQTVVRLALPAGRFVVMGRALVHNQQEQSAQVAFRLITSTGTPLETADATLPSARLTGVNSYATLPFLCSCTLDDPGYIDLQAIEGHGLEGVWLAHAQVTALQVQDVEHHH